jgi:hypothetical protein
VTAIAAFIARVFGGWRLYVALGIAAAVAAAGGYVWHLGSTAADLRSDVAQLQKDKGKLEAQLETAAAAAASNARELEAATVRHEAALRSVERYYEQVLADNRADMKRKAEALHAPDSDDGPVAPVLRRVLIKRLEQLRAAAGAAPDDRDEGRGSPRESPGAVPEVPPGAGATRFWDAAGRRGLRHRAAGRRAQLPDRGGAHQDVERGAAALIFPSNRNAKSYVAGRR